MGDAAWTADPNIQLLIHPLLGESLNPSIADSEEQCVVDSTGEARGEEQRESQQGGRRDGETQGERDTDHESVMEPVIEAERTIVDPDVIEMEGKTEIGRCPVRLIQSKIIELRKGQPNIGCREEHDQSIVGCMNGIVGILELVVA